MSPKFLIGLALAAGVVLPGAASAQRYDRYDGYERYDRDDRYGRDDPRRYVYHDRTGQHFDRDAWRAAEERRKRQRWSGYDRDDRREWRREQRRDRRRYRGDRD